MYVEKNLISSQSASGIITGSPHYHNNRQTSELRDKLVGDINGRVEHVLVAWINVPEGTAATEPFKARISHISIAGRAAIHNSPNTNGRSVVCRSLGRRRKSPWRWPGGICKLRTTGSGGI